MVTRPRIELAEPNLPLPRSAWNKSGEWMDDPEDQPEGWDPGDEACAACGLVILFAAPTIVAKWSPTDVATYWWHPGCWASYQEHRKAYGVGLHDVIGFPPVRGFNDGKLLDRAARNGMG